MVNANGEFGPPDDYEDNYDNYVGYGDYYNSEWDYDEDDDYDPDDDVYGGYAPTQSQLLRREIRWKLHRLRRFIVTFPNRFRKCSTCGTRGSAERWIDSLSGSPRCDNCSFDIPF